MVTAEWLANSLGLKNIYEKSVFSLKKYIFLQPHTQKTLYMFIQTYLSNSKKIFTDGWGKKWTNDNINNRLIILITGTYSTYYVPGIVLSPLLILIC